MFVFIGAAPRSDWLTGAVKLDERGFVVTGPVEGNGDGGRSQRSVLETSRPGVFAAGDVRSGSIKRVASAAGEGAMAVRMVHEYLGTMESWRQPGQT
jgi:thioredoxin reductase (NADPH)